MITQWDITSIISPTDNAILYALLIDGTEHDARLIAKKLQGYAQNPTPAVAPFVYRFELPADLDEDTLEKIRVAVREGIEQAKKVNEFIPGGALGNSLFTADVNQEDKAFPTFITLDPSESFFQAASQSVPNAPDIPSVNGLKHHQIDLTNLEDEIPQLAKTLEETNPIKAEKFIMQGPTKEHLEITGTGTSSTLNAGVSETDTSDETIPTSVESEEEWPEDPMSAVLPPTGPTAEQISDSRQDFSAAQEQPTQPIPPKTDTTNALPDNSRQSDDIGLEIQAVSSQDLPHNLVPPPPPIQSQQTPDLPITDKDMLIKDMEGTLLGQQSLDDIFLAETKYDMFVDLDKLTPTEPKAPVSTPEPSPVKETLSASDEGTETEGFNIFDQKIKDQTCFMDVNDVTNITERITQKDLSFLQHAHVKTPDAPLPNNAQAVRSDIQPQQPAFSAPLTNTNEVVMDPFAQLLAGSAATQESDKKIPTPPQSMGGNKHSEEDSHQDAAQSSETLLLQSAQENTRTTGEKPDNNILPTAPCEIQEKVSNSETEQKNRVIPSPTAPITERTMPEHEEGKKPFFRLKRKTSETQAPAAPLPPQVSKPAAPIPPQPEKPAAPQPAPISIPTPKPSPAPLNTPEKKPVSSISEPSAPQPQEEVIHTVLRKRRPTATFLEKTRTIDHSIELPLSELKKHNWPLEVPLIPTFTLENMTISINRFAHATAISVIDNPGKLYNPLVLHGTSGTGKTHFLHAIGYALSKKYGQENIFITNGVRLSRGIQRYVMEGNMKKFEEFTSSVKALLIDDIHLIAINEQNREHLSKLLNDFLAQKKQIIVTSKYPPESLAKLEELLNFKLDSGWISDLKQASGSARTRIIQKMLTSNGINITDDDVNRFFGHANMSLGTVARAIRRVRVLEKLIFPSLSPEQQSASAIFDQLLATKGEDQQSLITQKSPEDVSSSSVTGNGEWGRIGFFYPQNHSNMMNWLLFALQQRAKELGIAGGPELVVRSSYSTENIISSAFKIANLCDNKKLKGAVILGPCMDVCEPSVRENFYDILTHMLEIMLIRCGVINYEDAGSPSTYVKILSELLR